MTDERHSRTDLRDLSPPETVHDAVAALDLDAGRERVPLREARGRVLGERIEAGIDVPGFDRSALDGYAVRSEDTDGADDDPVTLSVVGRVAAGERPAVALDAGEAASIATGAVLPPEADAMVPVERVTAVEEDGRDGRPNGIRVAASVGVGENVSPAGADVAAGDRALGPGTRITERTIGLLAALGAESVPVRGRPKVGVLPTGAELVDPGDSLDHAAGEVHDVNAYTVAAAVESTGAEVDVRDRVGDDPERLAVAVRAAATDCDLVLTSGATSVGEGDVVRSVVTRQGELLLHGAAVKPGKPVLVGRIDGDTGSAGLVGLPGYPVSALTTLRTFVLPALRRAVGLSEAETASLDGAMAVPEAFDGPRRRLVAVALVADGDDDWLVYPVDSGSGAVTSLTDADGVVEMPEHVDRLDADERVTVDLFSPATRPPALLVAGESDPATWPVLDRVDARFLSVGTRDGLEQLRQGVPDAVVAAGPSVDPPTATTLADWRREWGLLVPTDNPDGVDGVEDLVDRDLRLSNRDTASGLRSSLAREVADLADRRGVDRHDAVASVAGFETETQGLESPARRVQTGRADVGVGLRATAERLGLGFVSLGDQRVRVLGNPNRTEKPAFVELAATLAGETLRARTEVLAGYRLDD
jgi:putative molybdopterin biosynthesis protein